MGAGCVSQILSSYTEIATPHHSGLLLSLGYCMVLPHIVFILGLKLKVWSLPWRSCCHGSVQSLSCLTLCDPMNCSIPGFPVHHQLPELTQTHVHRVGDATQPSHPLLSPSPPAFNLSQHQSLSQWVSSSHEVAKVLEFQLQHQSFQWIYIGLISFRKDWLDLLSVQGTLKSLLQHHSSKASLLQCSAFFTVQLLSLLAKIKCVLMVEKKKTMVYSQDGSYSFCLDVACVISAHVTFYRTSHMARPCVNRVGKILPQREGETLDMNWLERDSDCFEQMRHFAPLAKIVSHVQIA